MKRARPVDRNKPNKKTKDKAWIIPEIWLGETVFVVGGGPSLLNFDFEKLRGQRIVAINLAFTKMPFAQFVFFADNRFWGWHEQALRGFRNHICSTGMNAKINHPHYHRIARNHDHTKWFSLEKNIVQGKDSGVQAINMAFHLGGQRLILLGFDMGFLQLTDKERANKNIKMLQQPHITSTAKRAPAPTGDKHLAHWYKEHPIPSREQNYQTRFLPQYSQVYKIIKGAGREMFLATPSAINCIPSIDLDEVLREENVERICADPGQAPLPQREFYCRVASSRV